MDLAAFELSCRQFFYDGNESAREKMDKAVRQAEPHQRMIFTRLMASVRAEFHKDREADRRREYHRLLPTYELESVVRHAVALPPRPMAQPSGQTTVKPSELHQPSLFQSTSATEVQAMRSSRAKTVRRGELTAFLKDYASKVMIGPQPFLRSLFAVLALQTTDSYGQRCLQWDIDDAVFIEASGAAFARDALRLLVSVIGFRMQSPSLHGFPGVPVTENNATQSTALLSHASIDGVPTVTTPGSNPFTDPSPHGQQRRQEDMPLLIRTFVLPPYYENTELVALLKLFPTFISEPGWKLAHSMADSKHRKTDADLESASVHSSKKDFSYDTLGHGLISSSQHERLSGFKGSLLARFWLWLISLCF
ncbi:uncharacterized protein L969DRAFT_17261 [Mixia osmundae IAM 14324]|uniref:Uncharacterized protein n=1 Tax=Mixia osmundae (strain CBS 9802 / IAM 14324 / JCM 22182 / KY 12970) TaxID=764103 RepID=G7E3E1_MIXOS|nr:uncharacterized protein L969DRAFT_17261 [Mixia osmundae IAM 14324]KEI39337.1 hypothetical protein L969DRAFT_17261 [Mixia osmundae IAM 14324]GAA97351.1 hypothetical protein E5Q_04029 [Mixia osmundae IAM 14324]